MNSDETHIIREFYDKNNTIIYTIETNKSDGIEIAYFEDKDNELLNERETTTETVNGITITTIIYYDDFRNVCRKMVSYSTGEVKFYNASNEELSKEEYDNIPLEVDILWKEHFSAYIN